MTDVLYVQQLQDKIEHLETLNKALNETLRAMRNGEEPYHYCGYCLKRIKTGGDPEHLVSCEKAPYSKLMAILVREREHSDQIMELLFDIVHANELMPKNMVEKVSELAKEHRILRRDEHLEPQ